MQVVSQLLSKVEEGRMSRVCVRLSISCLLFIRKALPDSSFRIGRVDGVMVPLLNEDDSAGKYIIDLIEIGVIPALKDCKIGNIQLCIYRADGEVDMWEMIECYEISSSIPRKSVTKNEVPAIIKKMLADFNRSSSALPPLPLINIGVGIRVQYLDDTPEDYALPGFHVVKYKNTNPPCEADNIHISHRGTGCEVKLNIPLTSLE